MSELDSASAASRIVLDDLRAALWHVLHHPTEPVDYAHVTTLVLLAQRQLDRLRRALLAMEPPTPEDP